MRTTVVRQWWAPAGVAWAVATWAGAAGAQERGDSARVPTIAVLDFTSIAMRAREEFREVGRGIPAILITELQRNPRIQVLERARLREVLDEHDMQKLRDADPATVARVGELLGAQYLVTGGVLVDRQDRMRMDVRAIQVSSTRIVFGDNVNATGNDVFDALGALAEKMNTRMHLPGAAESRPARRTLRPGQGRLLREKSLGEMELDRKNVVAARQHFANFVADPNSAAFPEHRQKVEEQLRSLPTPPQ
jgi:TolB-like protein